MMTSARSKTLTRPTRKNCKALGSWSDWIYSLDGDVLRICLCENGDQIPNDFNTEEIGPVCFTFHRGNPAITSKTKDPIGEGSFQSRDNSQSHEFDKKTAETDRKK